MEKEYVEEVTSNDILLTEKGRIKKSPRGNKKFRKIVKGTFQAYSSYSGTVTLALRIVEKLKIFDPPMRLLQLDREAGKYYKCKDPFAFQIIQKVFSSFEPRDKHQTNTTSNVAKKKLDTQTNNACQDDQNTNPNQIVTTPKQAQRKRTNQYPSHSASGSAKTSPSMQPRGEETGYHLLNNIATLPPMPLNINRVIRHKTSIPSSLGNHAIKEMKMEWPSHREKFMTKIYVEDENCMEYDILYRGGRGTEIELASDAFRICLQEHFHHYQDNKNDPSARRRFHMSVLYELRQLNPEVRFLRFDKRKGKYYEWNHREAIEMILLAMEGGNKRRLVITPRRSKAPSSSSFSKPVTPTMEEPQSPPQSPRCHVSSRLPAPRTTAAAVERLDAKETRETQSTRMTHILRGEEMNPTTNCHEKTTLRHRSLDNGNEDGYEEVGNSVTPQKSPPPLPLPLATATPTTSEETSVEALPPDGSEMFPLAIDDDDDDDCQNQDQSQDHNHGNDCERHDHKICDGSAMLPIEIDDDNDDDCQNQDQNQDQNNGNDSHQHIYEEEYDEEDYLYMEQMNRAMEMGFQEG